MPERPAELDSPLFSARERRVLLIAASATLAYFCWSLLDDGDALNARQRNAAAVAISQAAPPPH